MPKPLVALVCSAALTLAIACTTVEAPVADEPEATTTSETPTIMTVEVGDPPPLDWVACRDGLECATLTVPLDYRDPARGTLDLAVARSRSQGAPTGSVVVNPGGPGGSGIDFITGSHGLGSFDLVTWDPRGVGDSRRLHCATDTSFLELDPTPDDDAERAALESSAHAIADGCGAADRELLETMTTETTARDLEQLRRALGDQPLNYLGFSYGTHIGLQYAALHPDRIRAMVLDGVVDPRETLTEMLTGQAVAMEAALGDDIDLYRHVAAQVEAAPIPASGGRQVGPALLGIAAFQSSYTPGGKAELRAALQDALAGDGAAVARLADQYIDAAAFAPYLGVLCVDGPRPEGPDAWREFIGQIQAAAPDLGAPVGNEVLPCAFWPADPQLDEPLTWPANLPPILLVAATGDAATPLDDAERVQAALPNAVLVVREGAGHTSMGYSQCVTEAVYAYLADLSLPKTTSCQS